MNKMRLAFAALGASCAVVISVIASVSWSQESSPSRATQKLCILNFERPEHGITKLLTAIYAGAPDTELRNTALPTDFLDCVKGGSEEILLIAHSLETPEQRGTQAPADLGYFQSAVLAGSGNSPAFTGYVLRAFLPKIMQLIRDELDRQERAGTRRLKKIRWMSCLPERVFARYPELGQALRDHSVSIDVAPKNQLMSWITGEDVTSPSLEWLASSVPREKLRTWRTESNAYCTSDYWPGCDRRTARLCLPK